MHLTLVIHSLLAGGAERVMTTMVNYWAGKGWNVTLLTFDDGTTPPFYRLDPRVELVALGIAGHSPNLIQAIRNNLRRIRVLRSAIIASNPECVISFLAQTNVHCLLATVGLAFPVVVEEHTHVGSRRLPALWGFLRRVTYPRAARVVGVTDRSLSAFPQRVRARAVAIPNPIVPPDHSSDHAVDLSLRRPGIISVGRLVPEKGYDILLRAFALLKDRHTAWTLVILGEGPSRSDLSLLASELGIAQRVSMPGQVSNPEDYLKQADLFVMASRFEGFPMGLCEAMACGLPVIHTDCPSGPQEIISDGVNGVLVPNEDVDALAAAMNRLMSDLALRKQLANNASEVIERFSLTKVMGMWEEVLRQLVKRKSPPKWRP